MGRFTEALETHGGKAQAARALGMSETSFRRALEREAREVPSADPLPPMDLSAGELIPLMRKRFELRAAHAQAKRWREFKVPTDGPYALMLFGDPHVDDDGCNWGLLENHCDLARETEHLYAISVGDASNNWVGRLTRLYANQETSVATARQLIKWLLVE